MNSIQEINLGHLTIKSVDTKNKKLEFHLKLEASGEDINTPCVRKHIKAQINAGVKYLTGEGFIDDKDKTDWNTSLSIESVQ